MIKECLFGIMVCSSLSLFGMNNSHQQEKQELKTTFRHVKKNNCVTNLAPTLTGWKRRSTEITQEDMQYYLPSYAAQNGDDSLKKFKKPFTVGVVSLPKFSLNPWKTKL